MTSGVLRPYTLADVLGTMNQQTTQAGQQIVGLGAFAEADETVTTADAAFITTATPAGWDQSQWQATQWQ